MAFLDIFLRGDRETRNGLRQIGQAARGVAGDVKEMGGSALQTALAVKGLDTAVGIAQAGVEVFTSSIAKTIELDNQLQRTVGGSVAQLEKLQTAFGQAIIGGENAGLIFGTVNTVLGALTGVVQDNADTIQSWVRDGILFSIEAATFGVQVYQILARGVDVLRIGFSGAKLGATALAIGIGEITLKARDAAAAIGDSLLEALKRTIGVGSDLAQIAGQRGIADSLDDMALSVTNAQVAVRQFRTDNAELSRELTTQLENALVTFNTELERTTDGTIEREAAIENLIRGLEDLHFRVETGRIADEAATRATEADTEARKRRVEIMKQEVEAERQRQLRAEAKDRFLEEQLVAEQKAATEIARLQQVNAERKDIAAFEAARDAHGQYVQGVVTGLAKVARGQQDLADATFGFVGRELEAEALGGIGRGIIRSFFDPAGGGALLAASGKQLLVAQGMKAVAGAGGGRTVSQSGASGSATRAGFAPPAAPPQTQQQNVSFTNQFQGNFIGDRSSAEAFAAELFIGARDAGFLQGAL